MSNIKTSILFLLEPTAMAGAEKVVINLINYLDIDKFNISLAVHARYLPGFQAKIFREINYVEYNVDPTEKVSVYRYDQLKKICSLGFDVISTHQNLPMIYLSVINPRATIVHTQHVAEQWRRWYWPDLFSENTNDQYVAVSSSVKDFLIARKHIQPSKITVINNGIDLEHCQPRQPIAIKKQYSIGPEDIVVGYLGRLAPQKNLEVFLDIARDVTGQSDRFKFFIVGDGPSEIILKAKASRENIPVNFVDWTDHPYDYLAMFNIFLSTSLYEGLSMSHLESLYFRNYLITTPVEGIKDLQEKLALKVIDNYQPVNFVKAILGFQPADLSGNPETIKQYFSAEAMTRKYEKIFLSNHLRPDIPNISVED